MTNTNLNLNDVVEGKMPMKKRNNFCLYHSKLKKGDFAIKSVKKKMNTLSLTNIRTKIAFTEVTLSLAFK